MDTEETARMKHDYQTIMVAIDKSARTQDADEARRLHGIAAKLLYRVAEKYRAMPYARATGYLRSARELERVARVHLRLFDTVNTPF